MSGFETLRRMKSTPCGVVSHINCPRVSLCCRRVWTLRMAWNYRINSLSEDDAASLAVNSWLVLQRPTHAPSKLQAGKFRSIIQERTSAHRGRFWSGSPPFTCLGCHIGGRIGHVHTARLEQLSKH